MQPSFSPWLLALLASAIANAQSHVAPATSSALDGNSRFWVAGTVQPGRQLTLIDASLLAPLQGQTIRTIAFRRNAEEDAFSGGAANLTLRLSHAPVAWTAASPSFDNNHGPDVTTVFQGQVTLPASPGVTGSQVDWAAPRVLEIALQAPFVYLGGTLALEVRGQPDPQNRASWWPADANWDQVRGSEQSVGLGCGTFGGPYRQWSLGASSRLVLGGTAEFAALGNLGDLAYWMLAGQAAANTVDLGMFGSPGCHAHLRYSFGGVLSWFANPLQVTQPSLGGLAHVTMQLPNDPSYLGATFASQWFGLGAQGLISSNAHSWTLAAQLPTLAMTLVHAPELAGPALTGQVVPGCGHVIRFGL